MRKRMAVTGLVSFARRVRTELASAPPPDRRDRLHHSIRAQLLRIDDALHRERLTPAALSPQARCAYVFLKQFDAAPRQDTGDSPGDEEHLDAARHAGASPDVPPDSPPDSPPRSPPKPRAHPHESVSITGLRASLESMLAALSHSETLAPGPIHDRIAGASRHLERLIEHRGISPESLRADHRAIRGWLAYFAQRESFDNYVRAVERASAPMIEAARHARFHIDSARVLFRPLRGIYAMRRRGGTAIVSLPTPMICFERELFASLAAQMFASSRRDGAVLTRMQAPDYRRIEADLERLGGAVVASRGVVHDLQASFDRVNRAYFAGSVPLPRLAWSRRIAGCKFGHYDFTTDEVQLSPMLDTPDVPEFAVDFVMYHELLHKRHGLRWTNGRGVAHTADFRREERRFERFAEADAVLNQLTARLRKGR